MSIHIVPATGLGVTVITVDGPVRWITRTGDYRTDFFDASHTHYTHPMDQDNSICDDCVCAAITE